MSDINLQSCRKLDNDVIQADSNYYLLCHIAKLVNEGFFYDGG